jgi:hypothetical protein
MTRRQAPLQLNDFKGGLNTEFNPLKVSPETTFDEENMEINRDGSRQKRLGFDYETNKTIVDSGIPYDNSKVLQTNLYRWENAGGNKSKYLIVTQVGNSLHIFDPDNTDAISSNRIYTETFPAVSYDKVFSFKESNGFLVVATGSIDIVMYEYDEGVVVKTTDRLKIRDLFGIQTVVDGVDITSPSKINVRPTVLDDGHIYNLRNQTYAYPYYKKNEEILTDPIEAFYDESLVELGTASYPSNADNLLRFFYPDSNDADDRLIERYWPDAQAINKPGITKAPTGFFVIDALKRSVSRIEEEAGASVLGEYAGRVWFGGFSGELIGGDSRSPRMSSYILFSRLIEGRDDITTCYQAADPTSIEDSALVATDGGFIRLDGAYGINKMVSVGSSLFVFAQNGVWRVTGSEADYFKATSYQVDKVSDRGCVSPNSVVLAEKILFYWSDDGIYAINQTEVGEWVSQSITTQTIQSKYLDIDSIAKVDSSGLYDGYEQKIRWVYSGAVSTSAFTEELVLNLKFSSFSYSKIPALSGNFPVVTNVGQTRPYSLLTESRDVTSVGVLVTDASLAVTAEVDVLSSGIRETLYLVLDSITGTITFSFGYENNPSFYDWGDVDTGIGYESFLLTGAMTGGEARYRKQVPYLNTFFRQTEDGFDDNLNVTNASSCLISTQWNWTDSINSYKWSTPRQAYRIGRLYFPLDASDTYDNGETKVSTRNKIRGWGESVAFKFEGEYGKNLHIYGWSFDLVANTKE